MLLGLPDDGAMELLLLNELLLLRKANLFTELEPRNLVLILFGVLVKAGVAVIVGVTSLRVTV